MGLTSSKSPSPNYNYASSGQSVYMNGRGDTVMDSYRNINGDFVRQTETGKIPATGGFISQSTYVPWMVAVVGTVFLVLSVFIFYTKQKNQNRTGSLKKSRGSSITEGEKAVISIPLYSLNKPRTPYQTLENMWNIDLLSDAE